MKLGKLNWSQLPWPTFPVWDIKVLDVKAVLSRSGLIIIMITVFMYAAVGLFYKAVIGYYEGAATKAKASPRVALKAAMKGVIGSEPWDSFKIVMERNLFGSTDNSIIDKQGDQGGDVAILFDLKGTIAGDRKYGFAVIEEKGKGKQGLYKVGDSVASAKLVQIRRNSVVLLMGGQEKILRMAERSEAPIFTPGAAAPQITHAVASGVIVISKNEIVSTINDMGAMLAQAKIKPYFFSGVPAGFVVSNIRPGSVFQKMRLMDGDVVQGINNFQIKTADDIAELYNILKSGANINLKIRRQGRQENLNYVFQ